MSIAEQIAEEYREYCEETENPVDIKTFLLGYLDTDALRVFDKNGTLETV